MSFYSVYHNLPLLLLPIVWNLDKSNIFSVLKEIFAGTNVKYSVLDKKIILSVEAQSPQQEKKVTVSGTVLDTHGEPVIGDS